MERICLLVVSLPFWTIVLIFVPSNEVMAAPSFSSMFVFGDSILDNGNNNYLNSLAKANFSPYGIDFSEGPTGRFCNGKTFIDLLGELLDLPYLPAFVDTIALGSNISSGVNYASAGGGILDETGRHLLERFTFRQQVQNFEITLSQLKKQMDNKTLSQHLAKSLTLVNHGSNDYINNYLKPELYATSNIYDPEYYADLLIQRYENHILALHGLGLRKFLLGGVGPLGCIPNQLSQELTRPGECRAFVNEIISMFNAALKSLVDQLNAEHRGSIFVYGNSYGALTEMIENPDIFGFTVTDSACCGFGRYQAQIGCLPMFIPCTNRDQYMFWDAFHPTQAVNKELAHRALTGPPSDCYPVNVIKMSQM